MNRRQATAWIAALSLTAATARSAARTTERATPEDAALRSTRYIDHTHPTIAQTAARVCADARSPTDCAVRLHDFVRDQISFGFAGAFYDQSASEVLASGRGFCNTKGTLLVALLRAAGIAARQRFVDIRADILWPLVEPGTTYVDHSYTEVLLEGAWRRTDSYIVDQALFERAQDALRKSGRRIGFAVHAAGQSTWDGQRDSFSQWVDDGSVPALSQKHHDDPAAFADVGAFYANAQTHNRLNTFTRLAFPALVRRANQRIESLRRSPRA
jgi:hypothetical protein